MSYLKNPFGYGVFLFVLTGGILLLVFDKGYFVLMLNDHHSPFWDSFFKIVTYFGDGIIFLPLFIGAFIYRYYYGMVTLVTSVLVLLFSQGLKKTFFSGWPRPTAYFDFPVEFNFVENVEVHSANTFPSGHTITAFAAFFLIALIINRNSTYLLFFLTALLAGVSRVYLLQHFFVDIYFGSILGILSVLLGILITNKIIGTDRLATFKNRSIVFK
ncbi:MAG: phosphatase PAP2 family protein [Cyclobacteriaceae bacterium]|nr:phosphatase PAP2 family protein [Cyclobacteriaceae bacterium]